MPVTVDLNSDLGESFGNWVMSDDPAMLDIVTSANVACGFHAGDPLNMRRTIEAARERGVAVGAHIGYPDLVGFGRRDLDISDAELIADVVYQIAAIQGVSRAVGVKVSYVKPHGALYNRIVHDEGHAKAVIAGIREVDDSLPVLGLPGSEFLRAAERAGLEPVSEAFADRAYTKDGSLVSRKQPGSVLHDPAVVTRRIVQLVTEGTIESIDGSSIRLNTDSVCVHGDTPAAVDVARAVRDGLTEAGVSLRPFVVESGTS